VIIFENISWRNFLSTGQQPTTINFNKNKTTLIIGSNGAGKSTLLDALCFSLYNKPFRKINRPQLINSINDRDVFVEVNFTIGKTKWKIERGIKPNIFKIYRDGKELDQKASAIDQQKWLEQNVLKMDFRSFTQVVILGSSNFVPFMQLSAAHRREVIEDLLDIKIFSSMNTLIKEKIRQSKEEIKILDLKKESFLDKVKMQENFIEELENRGKENIQKKLHSISTLDKEVEVFMRESGILEENIFEKQKEVEEYVGAGDKLRKFGTLKGKISQKVSTLTKEHKFFTENTVCPTCTQEIDDTFRINRINDAQNKAKELQSGYTELEEAIKEEEGRERQFNTITKEILKLTNDISQNNIKISGYQRQIRDLESEVQTITKQLENRNTEHEKLESFKDNLKITYDSLASKKDTINYYDFSYSLLKDGGVKSKIIKKYLPLINQQVNRYLQMMDFYINFEFDAEFNEYIKSPIHEDFSYASFSEGEKARIDLSLLFAWREVARLKNSANCNILLFDEVFDGSLDGFGADEFLKIVNYVVKDTNIFVISHKQDLQDKFDRTLIFEKIKGFSTIKEAK
jgi:DNA repair exonuclease SbcCD ATPase subunit